MNISLTKHIFGDAKLNPSKLIGVYGPKYIGGEGLSDNQIKNAIENPIGVELLRQMAAGCKKVLIVTDDNTRDTPLSRLIPPVLGELKSAGVSDEDIIFLIGLGTHRAMTQSEIKLKFGTAVANKYKIVNHTWNNSESLASLGTCQLGFEVVINKLALEADLIISIGSIVPHATTGFSGGGKTIMTGIAGERTIENTHWKALDYSMGQILGNFDNPIREAINSLSRKINLGMIINTILYNNGRIYNVVAGDVELAHARGVELSREVYSVKIPQTADIVIAEAHPADIDLRQAIKSICAADLVCRDNGVIILLADCPEGIAPQFPEFARYGFKNPDELYQKVNNGQFKQKLLAYTLVAIGRIISRKKRAILVSPHINSTQAEQMGLLWALNLQDAVDKAFGLTDNDAKVIVLKKASVLLPILQSGVN
jgi:nickel-dependent lactate racemase